MPEPARASSAARLHIDYERLTGYLDARDGKVDDRYINIPLKGTAAIAVTQCRTWAARAARGSGDAAPRLLKAQGRFTTVDCGQLAKSLEMLITFDKKLPVFAFLMRWQASQALTGTARIRAQLKLSPPTKEEFYASQLLRVMIAGVLIGAIDPSLSFTGMIDVIDTTDGTVIPKLCINVRNAATLLGSPALKTLIVTTGPEAKTLFKAVLQKYRITHTSP